MATHSFPGGSSDFVSGDNNEDLVSMALECKHNKRDFKDVSSSITFPILANNSS